MHVCGFFFFFQCISTGEAAQANRERIFWCAQSFCRNASDTSMLVSSFIFPAAARVKILLLIFKPHSSSSSSNSLENPEMRPPPPPAAMSNLLWRHFFWLQMPSNTPWSAAWTACSVETQGKTGTTNMVYKCLGSTAESLTVTEPDFFLRSWGETKEQHCNKIYIDFLVVDTEIHSAPVLWSSIEMVFNIKDFQLVGLSELRLLQRREAKRRQ